MSKTILASVGYLGLSYVTIFLYIHYMGVCFKSSDSIQSRASNYWLYAAGIGCFLGIFAFIAVYVASVEVYDKLPYAILVCVLAFAAGFLGSFLYILFIGKAANLDICSGSDSLATSAKQAGIILGIILPIQLIITVPLILPLHRHLEKPQSTSYNPYRYYEQQ